MNKILMFGSIIVSFALLSYSIAIISEQIKKQISKKILVFLSIGLLLDITATIFMIIGSKNSPFTFHGFLGYSALLAMLIETYLIWKHWLNNQNGNVSVKLNLYSRFTYTWWVLAYVAGALLASKVFR